MVKVLVNYEFIRVIRVILVIIVATYFFVEVFIAMGFMAFCKECGNLLYPEEERSTNTLNLKCRNCDFMAVAESTLIYRNELKHDEMKSSVRINEDIVFDRTLPVISKGCPDCKGEKAIFFSNRSTSKNADLRLTFVCSDCRCQYTEQDYQERFLQPDMMAEDAFEELGL